jgi:DNA-binding NarL/FixJ family response regulator
MDPRTAEIFELIREGAKQIEIAETMQLDERTIRRLVKNFQLQLRDKHGWKKQDGAR